MTPLYCTRALNLTASKPMDLLNALIVPRCCEWRNKCAQVLCVVACCFAPWGQSHCGKDSEAPHLHPAELRCNRADYVLNVTSFLCIILDMWRELDTHHHYDKSCSHGGMPPRVCHFWTHITYTWGFGLLPAEGFIIDYSANLYLFCWTVLSAQMPNVKSDVEVKMRN